MPRGMSLLHPQPNATGKSHSNGDVPPQSSKSKGVVDGHKLKFSLPEVPSI